MSEQVLVLASVQKGYMLKAQGTTQLRRKATWEKELSIEPRTHDLRTIAKFQPHKLRNLPCSFVPRRPLCASQW